MGIYLSDMFNWKLKFEKSKSKNPYHPIILYIKKKYDDSNICQGNAVLIDSRRFTHPFFAFRLRY